MNLFPLVTFTQEHLADANQLLVQWQHKMGPCNRPYANTMYAHILRYEGRPVGVSITAPLIRENVAKHPELNRSNTIELARMCAAGPDICRVVLRLWRLFVFEPHPATNAVSYQDERLHTGNTYRFDGWRDIAVSSSGTDSRSGRKGRRTRIWHWVSRPPNNQKRL